MALAGCAVGGSATGQGHPTSPRADLAAEAEVAARNLERATDGRQAERRNRDDRGPGRSGSAGPVGGSRSSAEAGPRAGSGSGPAAVGGPTDEGSSRVPASWSPLLTLADPAADQGGAPGYADIVRLTLEDDGRHLRVTLRLGEVIPGRLDDREVEGVGVDLFRADAQESDYQLFLDGGGHGWRGFLQTPRGFVAYPGAVAVRGEVLTTTVPWAALGGRRDGEVSAFVDWSDGTGRTGSDQVERGRLRPS